MTHLANCSSNPTVLYKVRNDSRSPNNGAGYVGGCKRLQVTYHSCHRRFRFEVCQHILRRGFHQVVVIAEVEHFRWHVLVLYIEDKLVVKSTVLLSLVLIFAVLALTVLFSAMPPFATFTLLSFTGQC